MTGPIRTCPECQQTVTSSPAPCPQCGTTYHAECRPKSGCVVPGCGRPVDRPPAAPRATLPWRGVRFMLVGFLVCLTSMWFRGSSHRMGLLVDRGLLEFGTVAFLAGSFFAVLIACLNDFRTGAAADHRAGTAGLMLLGGVPFGAFALGLAGAREQSVMGMLLIATVVMVFAGFVGLAADRRKLRGVVVLGLGGVAFVGMAIAVPGFKSARERANTRACYANQKTIVGAMEMYNLDKNTKRIVLDGGFFHDLKTGGYLGSIPQDPGFGAASSTNYHESSSGNGIRCENHGEIQ